MGQGTTGKHCYPAIVVALNGLPHGLADNGAVYEDSDGLVEQVRGIEGVELCLIFKELPDGQVKVSLRSNGKVNAFEIARGFGGGGHRMASGMRLDGPMADAIKKLVPVCEARLPDLS